MDSFSAISDALLATVDLCCTCLETSAPLGAPADCSVYWSTPPDDFFCDCSGGGFLAAWLEGITMFNTFPQPYSGPVRSSVGPLQMMAQISVRLVRPCWPVQQPGPDGRPKLPPRSETEPLALNLSIDAAVLMCCVTSDLASDDSLIVGGCAGATAPRLVHDRNRSGCAGMTLQFGIDLGSCCVPPA